MLRDDKGAWCGEFVGYIGQCSIIHAELWAINKGLKMAWGKEYTNVIVESDSMDVIKILQGKVMLPASCKSLIELIQRLWRQNWVVKA